METTDAPPNETTALIQKPRRRKPKSGDIKTNVVDGDVYVCLADLIVGIHEGQVTVPGFDTAKWLESMFRRAKGELAAQE
jgi:hypothetical protein